MNTKGRWWCCCAGRTFREPRAWAVLGTWPTTKCKSCCSCRAFWKCSRQSAASSTSTARPVAGRWTASRVGNTSFLSTRETSVLAVDTPMLGLHIEDECCPLVGCSSLKPVGCAGWVSVWWIYEYFINPRKCTILAAYQTQCNNNNNNVRVQWDK